MIDYSNIHLLIIDDDVQISFLLKKILVRNNFIVLNALNIKDAETILNYFHCDIIILDYMLPCINGIEFLKKLRLKNIITPVIMLTASNETNIKLESLKLGADDYLSKPFLSEELLLRIKNILKRSPKNYNHIINFSGMSFNLSTGELYKGTQFIPLSTLEENLLKIFVNNLGQIVTKEYILQNIGKAFNEDNFNAINVSIMRLRKKIESQDNKCIKTIRHQGYLLKP